MGFTATTILQMLNIIQQMLFWKNHLGNWEGTERGEGAVFIYLLLVKCRLVGG